MSSKLPSSDSEANSTNQNQGGRLPFSRYALFFLPCLIGVVVDLATKTYMFANYFDPTTAEQAKTWWIDGIFGIQTSTNPGALFGIGGGYSWFFAGFSIFALMGILVWLFRFGGAYDRWLTFALGLVSGGILGNFYDRVGLGYSPSFPVEIKNNVRDWILFELDGVKYFDPWPNFNIADVCLVFGAVMLFVHAFLYVEPESQNEEAETASTTTQ